MTERVFRFILGLSLLACLYFQLTTLVYIYIGILAFEGLTNWRIPILVSRLRYGAAYKQHIAAATECPYICFDAERALRVIVVLLLVGTFVMFPQQTWFFPWFIAFMLLVAGITNICPMVMGLRWVGFR